MRTGGTKNIAMNAALALLSIALFFGALEGWARYKYYGGSFRQKGFFSRGKAYTPKKTTPVRIVCVGGSTTHGGSAVEDNETYPFYLEKIINERRGQRTFVEVVNSGLPAKPTEFHRNFIKERIGDQELDILIIHSLYNHFSSLYPYGYNPEVDKVILDYGKGEKYVTVKTVYRWAKMRLVEIVNVFLMEHSYFYTRLREKMLRIVKKDINEYYAKTRGYVTGENYNTSYRAETEDEREHVLSSFINRYYHAIEDIVLTAKARDVDVILIIPPYPFFEWERLGRKKNKEYHRYYDAAFKRARLCLEELGKRYGLLVIDADEEFKKTGRRADIFHDDIHLTGKGNYMLADIIASEALPRIRRRLKE